MPPLKRIVSKAPVPTPEALFARALHDVTHRDARKAAAAACAAPASTMASGVGTEADDEELDSKGVSAPLTRLAVMSLEDCIHSAITCAEQEKTSLFVIDSASYVAKSIRYTLDIAHDHPSSTDGILRRIMLQQTRDVDVLLSILHDLEHSVSKLPTHVFIGPLCAFFSSFLTTTGLTATGDGLLRMVHLAHKRLRLRMEVTIIRNSPLFEAPAV